MAAPAGRTGRYAAAQGPPGKLFLGLAAMMFAVNHLSVVWGNGLMPEALVMGSWVGLMGTWASCAGRSFEAVWGWAKRSARREIGLGLLTFVAAIGLAEAVAWGGYRQHLWR